MPDNPASLKRIHFGENQLEGELRLVIALFISCNLHTCANVVSTISGTLPVSWSKCTTLHTLDLGNNALTGEV